MSCGKRIWSDAISIPGHGEYHYECAELTGAISLVLVDDETIKKKMADIEDRYSALKKLGRGATDDEWSELNRIIVNLSEEARIAELVRRKRQKSRR